MTLFSFGTGHFFNRKMVCNVRAAMPHLYTCLALGLLTIVIVMAAINAAAPLFTEMRIQNAVNLLRQERLTAQRHQAMSELENDGERAVPALITALHSDDPVLRRNAADILSYIVTPQALAAMQPGQ